MSEKPKRRWFQFSLKTLLVTIALMCLALGYVVYKRDVAARAKVAAETLKIRGASYEFPPGKMPGMGNEWSVAILGDDAYEHIAGLSLRGSQFHDADLTQVAKLKSLRFLSIHDSDISDAGLRRISLLSLMAKLYLVNCKKLTDDGLHHLRPMTHLKELGLEGTLVSDEGLKTLEGFGELDYLDLNDTRITDAGLAKLSKMPALKWLSVGCTGVSDAGLGKLREMQQLETLGLSNSGISDSGLVYLQEFPRLKFLDLTDTRISDHGLVHLRKLKQLEFVWLAGTRTTENGIQDLQRELPQLRISLSR
jgi:internalin A